MLCFQCRRIAASALRRTSAAVKTNSVKIPHAQARTFLSAIPRQCRPPQSASIARYSTASNSAANPAKPAEAAGPEKPDYLNDMESAIWDKLVAEFSPTNLLVQDISGGCGSMYGIEIESEKFRGLGMLKQQRMVNAVLGDEMKGWHGVQLRTTVPR
ncbi:bola-like protein [Xylaria intraflava]|nr:bola-like protein [Xylaria intraflava]